jgi:hypothetical protein
MNRVNIFNRIHPYITGLTIGTILSLTIGLWTQSTILYRIIFVVLFIGLILFVTWSEYNSDKSDNNTNNRPLKTMEYKSRQKGKDSTNES